MIINNKYNYFYNKIKDLSYIDTDEFFRFYNLLKKYDFNIIKNIYPKKTFDTYISILEKDLDLNTEIYELDNAINLNQSFIEYFIDLSQSEDFGVSEKNLNLSRQAIKKGIENIEKYFNTSLFEKKDFKNTLTKQGIDIYPYIIKILANLRNIDIISKKNLYGQKYNENNLHFMSMSYYRNLFKNKELLNLINLYNKKENFSLDLNFVNLDKIKESIALLKTDFGIISNIPNEPYLDFFNLGENPYVIVGKKQEMQNYQDLDYIFPEKINDKNMKIMHSLVEDKVKIRANVIDLCIKIAEEGKCCFFTPEILVRDKIKEGKLAIISKPPIDMSINLCITWNRYIYLNNISIKYINLLKNIVIKSTKESLKF